MRADAQRNRASILAAAKVQITETEPDVSMDSIAKAAGVAVSTCTGTTRRRRTWCRRCLPSTARSRRAALAAGSSLRSPGVAWARLVDLLTEFVEESATNQAIKEAARVLDVAYMTPELQTRADAAMQVIISAAVADRDLR